MRLNSRGFTLVEVVIAVGVVGILLTIISIFAINTLSQSSVESAKANLLGESQIAMDRVINDIRLSAGADQDNRWPDANNPGGPLAWVSNGSTLVLATAAVDGNNNVIFADPAQYISEKNNVIYFVQNGILYKRTLASTVANNAAKTTCPDAQATADCLADRALLHNVTDFDVTYLNGDEQEVAPSDANAIELRVATHVRKFSQDINSDYTTRAVFRND